MQCEMYQCRHLTNYFIVQQNLLEFSFAPEHNELFKFNIVFDVDADGNVFFLVYRD